MAMESRPGDGLPHEFPRRLLRRHKIEDAEKFAQELRAIQIRRMRIIAAAEDADRLFDINAALGDKLEAKLRATTNPVVREGHKQHYLRWLSRAERLLDLDGPVGGV